MPAALLAAALAGDPRPFRLAAATAAATLDDRAFAAFLDAWSLAAAAARVNAPGGDA